MARDYVLQIRLNPWNADSLRGLAKGQKLSAWARDVLLDKLAAAGGKIEPLQSPEEHRKREKTVFTFLTSKLSGPKVDLSKPQ